MTFDEWFNETEIFSLRSERFYADLFDIESPNVESPNMIKWLRAAYQIGYEQGKYDSI